MDNSESYIIQLTSDQKILFDSWLNIAQKELEVKLEAIKSLRKQTSNVIEKAQTEVKSSMRKSNNRSWTSKTINALEKLGGAQTSTQIISWLIENDAELENKDKRQITKNVTSKLAILVDKGRLEKRVVNGKNVYSLKIQN